MDFEAAAAHEHSPSPSLHVEELYPRLPALVAKARRWLDMHVPHAMHCLCDANHEEIAAMRPVSPPLQHDSEHTPSVEHDSEDCVPAEHFSDAWYRSAVRNVVRDTVARCRHIAKVEVLVREDKVLTHPDGRVECAWYEACRARKADGFPRLSTNLVPLKSEDVYVRNGEISATTKKLAWYMRGILGASLLERAVVITMVRNHVDDLFRPASDEAENARSWVSLYMRSRAKWTDDTKAAWATAFKKRFTSPVAYIDTTNIESHDMVLMSLVEKLDEHRMDVALHGVDVLLSAGIDAGAAVSAYGTIFESVVDCRTDAAPRIRAFVAGLHAVYAKHPEFEFAAFMNLTTFRGQSDYGMGATENVTVDSRELSELLLYLISYGYNVDILKTTRPDTLWQHTQAILRETRAAGISDTELLAIAREATVCTPDPSGERIEELGAKHIVRLHPSRRTIDVGESSPLVLGLAHVCDAFTFTTATSHRLLWRAIRRARDGILRLPWWAPKCHRYYSKIYRQCIHQVFLIAHRLDTVTYSCGRLPPEMWCLILSFLPRAFVIK